MTFSHMNLIVTRGCRVLFLHLNQTGNKILHTSFKTYPLIFEEQWTYLGTINVLGVRTNSCFPAAQYGSESWVSAVFKGSFDSVCGGGWWSWIYSEKQWALLESTLLQMFILLNAHFWHRSESIILESFMWNSETTCSKIFITGARGQSYRGVLSSLFLLLLKLMWWLQSWLGSSTLYTLRIDASQTLPRLFRLVLFLLGEKLCITVNECVNVISITQTQEHITFTSCWEERLLFRLVLHIIPMIAVRLGLCKTWSSCLFFFQ